MTEIISQDFGHKGRYVYSLDGDEAELAFVKVGDDQIILSSTRVPDAWRGQGIAAKLVAYAVEDARRRGLRIKPLCPYAAAQFRRHPEWDDLLVSSSENSLKEME